jgi:hypothetical protein
MSMTDQIVSRMRRMIGKGFEYLGEYWTLIEVLADEQSVVLQRGNAKTIQADQYGRANRRAGETLVLQIFNDGELSPDLMELLAGKL